MAGAGFETITCAAFAALPEAEQRAFIEGVVNGREVTYGLYRGYAGLALGMAGSAPEQQAIRVSYREIRALMEPLLRIDADSLLNGVRAACARPELRDQFVIEALASVHSEAAHAIRAPREQAGGAALYVGDTPRERP
jgi:hypothetical protein